MLAIGIEHGVAPLTATEADELAMHERTIRECLDATERLLVAFAEIRSSRLYRQKASTFEEYCLNEFGHSRNYGNKKAAAGEVLINLISGGFEQLPIESQARPMVRLSATEQREAWGLTLEAEGEPTAIKVEAAIARVKEYKSKGAIVKLEAAMTDEQADYLHQEATVTEKKRNGALVLKFEEGNTLEVSPGLVSLIEPGEPPAEKTKKATASRAELKALLATAYEYYSDDLPWPDEFVDAVVDVVAS